MALTSVVGAESATGGALCGFNRELVKHQDRSRLMRLLVPFRFFPNSMKGGIEEAFYSTMLAMVKHVDTVIIVSERSYQPILQARLPKQENIIIKSYPLDLNLIRRYFLFILEKFCQLLNLGDTHPLCQRLKVARHNHFHRYWRKVESSFLNSLTQKYNATHCLYFFYKFQEPPILPIPIFTIVYDLWWNEIPCDSAIRAREDACLVRWVQKCDRIFAISEQTQGEIFRIFPQAKEQVKVIPLGIDSQYSEGNKLGDDHSPIDNLFFYPAQFKYNKSHITLLQAAYQLATQGYKFEIILTGFHTDWLAGDTPLSDSRLEKCRMFYHLHHSLLAPHFQIMGYCERKQVELFYSMCRAVVLPTIYEGFGLPLVEGLARGVQVICSDLTVFREHVTRYKCEKYVSFFPPQDADSLAQCLINSMQTPKSNISFDSLKPRLARWTWEDVANAYLKEITHQS